MRGAVCSGGLAAASGLLRSCFHHNATLALCSVLFGCLRGGLSRRFAAGLADALGFATGNVKQGAQVLSGHGVKSASGFGSMRKVLGDHVDRGCCGRDICHFRCFL